MTAGTRIDREPMTRLFSHSGGKPSKGGRGIAPAVVCRQVPASSTRHARENSARNDKAASQEYERSRYKMRMAGDQPDRHEDFPTPEKEVRTEVAEEHSGIISSDSRRVLAPASCRVP